ncbi:MAG: HAD-IA family hydrolase [Pseudomonadota bacterium]
MQRLDGTVCIFDLDGTLVDSAPDLARALNRALVREGLSALPLDEVKALFGHGAEWLITAAFQAQGRDLSADPERDRILETYLADYAAHIFKESRVFDGAVAALEALRRAGATLAICTNKVARLSLPLIEAAELDGFFDVIISGDQLAERKPSPLPLNHIVERTRAQNAIMIGDGYPDFGAANAARIPALMARSGYGKRDRRLADAVWFDDYATLHQAVINALMREEKQR